MIPAETGDWTLIFSKDYQAWGSFFYNAAHDQARLKVTPQNAEFEEWLRYGFEDITNNSTVAYLHWEKKKIPFKIEVDVNKIVLDNIRTQLTNLAGFNSQAWQQGANYCLQNNLNHQEALVWIDRAIQRNKNAQNLATKAALLSQANKDNAAVKTELTSLAKETATEADINNAGYVYLFSNFVDDAIGLFKLNVERFPDSWNTYDSLGEGFDRKGDKANAIKYYEMAYDKAPSDQHARIEGILKKLKGDS
jgi:tetratricopeptide (TPR) repeat protein